MNILTVYLWFMLVIAVICAIDDLVHPNYSTATGRILVAVYRAVTIGVPAYLLFR